MRQAVTAGGPHHAWLHAAAALGAVAACCFCAQRTRLRPRVTHELVHGAARVGAALALMGQSGASCGDALDKTL